MKLKLAMVTGLLFATVNSYAISLKDDLEKTFDNVEIAEAPIAGFKAAITDQGIYYIKEDGKFFIAGNIFEKTPNGGFKDVTKKPLMKKLNALSDSFIEYKASNEKYVVNVFVDVSCYYCEVMFKQTQKYNDLGITLRYLAYPRAGLKSDTAKEMEAIWSDENPINALFNKEIKKISPKKLKTPDIVAKHYKLGFQFGLRGTPMLVLDEGETISGYVKPQELLNLLNKK